MEIEKHNVKIIDDPKDLLFNLVSSCMLQAIRYYDTSDDRKNLIFNQLTIVSQIDPKFILKLAYYLRNKLYIRTTTNFILGFAACNKRCRPFLMKYYSKSILLPTDLLECSQFAMQLRPKIKSKIEILQGNSLISNFGTIPEFYQKGNENCCRPKP